MRITMLNVSRQVIQFLLWSLLASFAWAWRGPAGAVIVLMIGMAVRTGMRDGWWGI